MNDEHETKSEVDAEAHPAETLSETEVKEVAELKGSSARVVHEVIRLQGDEELGRPVLSLLFSAFAAGLAITASVLAEVFLRMRLPTSDAAELISQLGYSVGFVLVVLGNLQLFTENTVAAVLPLATHPTLRNLGRLGRLWTVVLLGNLAGTFAVAALIDAHVIVDLAQRASAIDLSSHLLRHGPAQTLLLGIPAGFLIASLAWVLPSARGSEFWLVTVVTYIIAIGGFSHVVAGSTEAWLMWLSGKATLGWALLGFIGPALIGNIIGGTGLFAVLAHGQVRDEIVPSGTSGE